MENIIVKRLAPIRTGPIKTFRDIDDRLLSSPITIRGRM